MRIKIVNICRIYIHIERRLKKKTNILRRLEKTGTIYAYKKRQSLKFNNKREKMNARKKAFDRYRKPQKTSTIRKLSHTESTMSTESTRSD